MKKRLKINGVVMFLATILLMVFPAIFLRKEDAGYLDEVAEIFGIALVLLGQLIRVSARGFKSENSQDGNVLISGGPYSLVRNPMYLGIFLIGFGVVLMLFEWWVIAIFLVFFIVRYILLIFQEEKKLKALFLEEYNDYCRRVPRILPSIKALWEKDICEYLPLRLSWVMKEIGAIVAVLFLVLLLESWENIKSSSIVLYIKELGGLCAVVVLFILLAMYLSSRTVGQNVPNKK